MGIIIFIIMIIVFAKLTGKALGESAKVNGAKMTNAACGPGTYQPPKAAAYVESVRTQAQQQVLQSVEEQIAKTKQRILESPNRQAMQQVQERRRDAANTTIVERAKKHTDEKKVDVTLESMEAEHNHSERVSAAVHHHPEDILTESMLGSVEDLMVKGFDGKLCFERDFIGEGLDMISRFSYQ
jgi:hypothetical protein